MRAKHIYSAYHFEVSKHMLILLIGFQCFIESLYLTIHRMGSIPIVERSMLVNVDPPIFVILFIGLYQLSLSLLPTGIFCNFISF